MYECECGRTFEKRQSYVAHTGHCEIHLGYKPKDRFGDARAWRRGLTKDDPKYGDSIARSSSNSRRKDLSEVLVKGNHVSTIHLKWRLIEEGVKKWRCERCNNTEWLGDKIPLELHHKDGDRTNNELDNLELLCPNCHAFTDTYRGRNMNR